MKKRVINLSNKFIVKHESFVKGLSKGKLIAYALVMLPVFGVVIFIANALRVCNYKEE